MEHIAGCRFGINCDFLGVRYTTGVLDAASDSLETKEPHMRISATSIGLAFALTNADLTQVAVGAPDRDRIELTRQAITTKRQALVTSAIDLTPEEAESFWPMYREWRAETAELGDRMVRLIEQVMDDYDNLVDWLRLERDRVKLKTPYVKRFRKILPHKKVARFVQLDNKMDTIVDYGLVERVPLVE